MERYQRVLVISTVSFNLEAGGGVTMSNLFKGWPKDRIAQIYSYGVKNKDLSVCRTYYHIPGIHRGTALQEGRPLFGPGMLARGLRRSGARRVFRVPSQFQEAIAFARRFKPDVAYVRPMDKPSSYWWLCRDLCRLLDIPYVTHIMDDWPARYCDDAKSGGADGVPGGWRGRIKSARMDASLRALFADAVANIAISPEMAAGYLERYGRQFLPFHNSVDVSHWESRSQPRPAGQAGTDRPFVIRYIGAVVPDKELQSLKEIGRAVRLLNERGRRTRLEIHCGPAWNATVDEHLADEPVVGRGAVLTQDQLPAALSSADLLVLPINFDQRSMRYIGYSMQTKGPEYMASATPILVYGPASNPNVRYARDARWGVVIDQQDPQGSAIAEEIARLMDDPDRARRIGLHGRTTARSNHDAGVVRTQFQQLIARAATGSSPS